LIGAAIDSRRVSLFLLSDVPMSTEQASRFILMPANTTSMRRLEIGAVRAAASRAGLRMLSDAAVEADPAPSSVSILDKIGESGPELVELLPEAARRLEAEANFKLVPIATYQQARADQAVRRPPAPKAGSGRTPVRVVDAATKAGVAGATVIAFTDFEAGEGAEGVTAADGQVMLDVAPGQRLDRLYVHGPAGYWGHVSRRQRAGERREIKIAPLKLRSRTHILPCLYGASGLAEGRGVRIAIIDSGVAAGHPALPHVMGGANVVFDEIRINPASGTDWGPASVRGEHGTHVAGIVGARPTAASAVAGIAPGVELRSYRVFPHGGGKAKNYDIMKAVDLAVQDRCHIINLSLSCQVEDDGLRYAIADACRAGVLVVAAAGNDQQPQISFPAAVQDCIAVAAMGRRGTFPARSAEAGDVTTTPTGNDPKAFVAAFSNQGEVDLIGPGVGVVSTLPGGGYGVMSGTSMACPAVVGIAARLYAADPSIARCRADDRVAHWTAALIGRAGSLGFGRPYEGHGLPL
jgi:subtilisin